MSRNFVKVSSLIMEKKVRMNKIRNWVQVDVGKLWQWSSKGPFLYYVSTWRGRGTSKNCPYCLFSEHKICLQRGGGGGQKSPKLCLRNIWMVPGDHLNSFWPAMRAQVTSKDTYFLHIAYCYQVHNVSKLFWSLITNQIHIVPYVRQWGQIRYEVRLHLNL